MKQLNKEWRGKDKTTDVLSFPVHSFSWPFKKKKATLSPILNLGDIFISEKAVEKQAKELGWSLSLEWTRLAIHGVFHLMGYDHERSPKEDKVQTALEKEVLEELWPKHLF